MDIYEPRSDILASSTYQNIGYIELYIYPNNYKHFNIELSNLYIF